MVRQRHEEWRILWPRAAFQAHALLINPHPHPRTAVAFEAKDRAAATVALRVALVELLSEDWSPLGSFIVGDPFDRMGEEDQLRGLNMLRRVLSRIPQVILLTRGTVVERAPEFFDGLFEFREATTEGLPPLRSLPAGVGILRVR